MSREQGSTPEQHGWQGPAIGLALALAFHAASLHAGEAPQVVVNSLGMKMLPIPAGTFQMGSVDGEFDERPVHQVTIRQPFLLAATEVTNAQYEQFDPKHRALRGKRDSREDDEAVIFVSWHEAMAFCKWLTRRRGSRTVCRPRRSGNMPAARGRRPPTTPATT